MKSIGIFACGHFEAGKVIGAFRGEQVHMCWACIDETGTGCPDQADMALARKWREQADETETD